LTATSGATLLLGVVVASGSAVLYDAGYVLEKKALAGLPPVRPHPLSLLKVGVASRRWLLGFAVMLAALALQVVALTLAPVAVVQPILAAGLIGLAAIGGSVLDERLHRRQLMALGMLVTAVVAVGVSTRAGEHVAGGVRFAAYASLSVPVALGAIALGWWGITRGRLACHGDRTLVAVGCAAGLFYGLGAVAEKAVSTRLVADGVVGGSVRALATPYPWLFLLLTAGGMVVFQVGLQRYPATMMATFTNVTSSACVLLGAAAVFGESLLPGGWWSAARLVSFSAVIGAVGLLASTGTSPTAAASTDVVVSP
jgi:multidrug transporter EmrE-like cation transporter